MQKLIMPFRKSIIECGYKSKAYLKSWGYEHYGIDITVTDGVPTPEAYDHTVYASGDGKVVWCQKDVPSAGAKSLGWALAIRYDGCISRDGKVENLIARYMHCDAVYVGVGATVKQGQKIAHESNVGTSVAHLHFELDKDTAYPQYSPQVSAGHSGWAKGYRDYRDSTVNPSLWLWQMSGFVTMPYPFTVRDWIMDGIDDNIPFVPNGVVSGDDLIEKIRYLEERCSKLEADNSDLVKENSYLKSRLAKIYDLAKT